MQRLQTSVSHILGFNNPRTDIGKLFTVFNDLRTNICKLYQSFHQYVKEREKNIWYGYSHAPCIICSNYTHRTFHGERNKKNTTANIKCEA